MRRIVAALALLALSACTSYEPGEPRPGAPPLPVSGPIAYRCDNGAQLMVDFQSNQARVAIVGGPSMVLPNAGPNYYSNGRYGFRGGGAAGQWEVGRSAPVNCRGG